MKPIKDWDKVTAPGAIETLPSGAYICDVKQVREVTNRNSPGTHLEISFDVCEGENAGFFQKDYSAQDREDKFWRGIINQNVPDEASQKYEQQCKFFKRFINAIEDGNPGYHWDWNEAGLKGRKLGIVFGEHEKESQRGTVYTITRPEEIISVEDVRNGKFKIPEKKTIRPKTSAGGYGYGYGGLPSAPVPDDSDCPFL